MSEAHESRVALTPAAAAMLRRLAEAHGPLMFHQSGGCCDGSAPMCYPVGMFRVGASDVLLGTLEVDGIDPVRVYMSASQFEYWKYTHLTIDLVDGRASVVGAVRSGYVYVDGLSVGEVTETSLKDRRILGDEGFVSIVVVMDSATGKVSAGPEIHARGSGIDDAALVDVVPRIQDAIEAAVADGMADTSQLQQVVRRVVGRWVNENYRRRPMIIPLVVEV